MHVFVCEQIFSTLPSHWQERATSLPHFCDTFHKLPALPKKGFLVFLVCSDTPNQLAKAQKEAQKQNISPLQIHIFLPSKFPPKVLSYVLEDLEKRETHFTPPAPSEQKGHYLPQKRLSRRELFSLPTPTIFPLPVVERELCRSVHCGLCITNCPHGAFSLEDGEVFLHREKCTSCGHCVSLCPQQAIRFPRWSYTEVFSSLKNLASHHRGILFHCLRTSLPALKGWIPFAVPCQAFLTPSLLLAALYYGASQVGIYSCGADCPNEKGELLKAQVGELQNLAEKAGLSPSLFQYFSSPGEIPPSTKGEPLFQGEEESLSPFGKGSFAKFLLPYLERAKEETPPLTTLPLGLVEIGESCTLCGTCATVCPPEALVQKEIQGRRQLFYDHSLCLGCNTCLPVCPERQQGAIQLRLEADLALLKQKAQVARESDAVYCERCGKPFASSHMVERIKELLGDNYQSSMGRLCSDCRGFSF